MSLVRELMLSRGDWLTVLVEEYKIKVNRDGDLASLKYDQIESPMHEPIVQECRGMVVDVPRRRVLAWPYNKFWNHGDVPAAPIDWSTACVQEKLDGSLMILYWHDVREGWLVASSGTPLGSGSFGDDADRTFGGAFWNTFRALGMRLPNEASRDVCFMFEMCDAPNRVVVKHDRPRIVLHGARNHLFGRELSFEQICGAGQLFNWEVVRTFPVASIADCLAAANALDPIAQEGFVVVDAAFNRVKIKSPRYVALHHMKGEATPRRAVELWQTGETAELLSHFPEMAAAIEPVQDRLEVASLRALADFIENRRAPTRKDFALAVKDRPWSAATFRLYGVGGGDLAATKQIMRGLSLAALERIAEAA